MIVCNTHIQSFVEDAKVNEEGDLKWRSHIHS